MGRTVGKETVSVPPNARADVRSHRVVTEGKKGGNGRGEGLRGAEQHRGVVWGDQVSLG